MTPDITAWRELALTTVVSVYVPCHIRCSRTPSSASGTSRTDRVEGEEEEEEEEAEELR